MDGLDFESYPKKGYYLPDWEMKGFYLPMKGYYLPDWENTWQAIH